MPFPCQVVSDRKVEKWQAFSGPWSELVREITNEYYLCADGISDNMDLDHARGRDFQNLAQTIYCINQLPNQVHGTTMQIEKWFNKEDPPPAATRQKFHDIFKVFREIARHKQLKLPLKRPSRVAPAEFIMIGILIATYKDRLSLPQLSQAIGILRSETRAVHADIRTNSNVFKTMFQVLSKKIKPSNLTETPGVPVAGSPNGKRKRDVEDEQLNDGKEESMRKPRELPLPKSIAPKPPSAPRSPSTSGGIPAAVRFEGSRPVCDLVAICAHLR